MTLPLVYPGGFSSPANQPTLSDFIGSAATFNVMTVSHRAHSKLRRSKPLGTGMMRASCIRCMHLGQRGRSMGMSDGPLECECESGM
jgi:hypothetical protein